MTDFVKRIEQNIDSARRSGEVFEGGKVIMALVPEAAHTLALADVDNYIAGIPGIKLHHTFKPTAKNSMHTIQMRGILCHIVRSDVAQEMFVVAKPVPQAEIERA